MHDEAPNLDVEPPERVTLKGRLMKKLFDFRLESTSLTETMMRTVEDSDYPKAKLYSDLMAEVLSKTRPVLTSSPVQ